MWRLAVTGMAGITALGSSWPEIQALMRVRGNSIRYMAEWERYADLDNFDNPDRRRGELDYIVGSGRELDVEYAMGKNFAFGVNTSLVFRWR